MAHVHGFMRAVLGDTAATALRKATDRSEALDSVVGSRVIIGWLGFAAQFGYDGEIPGLPGSMLSFRKADDGSLFNGAISIGGDLFDFQHASQTQLAATLSVALGANRQVSPTLRDSDLVPLGKNIDLLIKGQVLRRLQKQTQEPSGVAAAPRAPDAPQEPGAPLPQKKGNVQPPRPGVASLKVTKSQAASKCSVCDAPSFNRRGDFTACFCMRDLAKSASSVPTAEGYEVTFDTKVWTQSNLQVLSDILEGEGK
jgi:hypothetical protein